MLISDLRLNILPDNTLQMRTKIILAAAIWWLLLALLSRLDLSTLQIVWSSEVNSAIFIYFPCCILLGGLLTVFLSRPIYLEPSMIKDRFPTTEILFYILMSIFIVQCFFFEPPLLAKSPNDARLEWGFPYLHVITEISIRVMCLLIVGNACAIGRLTCRDRLILISSLAYTAIVVSRSFMLEIIFYWCFANIIVSSKKRSFLRNIFRYILFFIILVGIFILSGEWRQGSDFSIVEYANLKFDSNALAWVFGYFLVNFDNLALLIREQYQNAALSNVFGSLLQTLKITHFEHVDSYLYVGKFNLGTAFRPFVLDFGVWIGGLVFALFWSLVTLSPSWCKKSASYGALHALIAYYAFCLPLTSRIEQPPYLFALIWIVLADRFTFIDHQKINES